LDHKLIVRTFVGELLRTKGDTGSYADDESLIAGGRLASIDVLHLVVFLEEQYCVDFSNGFDPDDLDTVDSIVALTSAGVRS
jgi:acyl carrier protein